jgi:hypothetical protein
MAENFRLLMLSAMYENGGNTTHRFLDGHPQMFVYPFESQLGTRLVVDHLQSVFPVKYRWPVFPLHGSAAEDYQAIIDEECKVRTRTPHVSKFRHVPFDLSDDDRRAHFERIAAQAPRSRGGNVRAFFEATRHAWRDLRRHGDPLVHVGYSPIVVVDTEAILHDFPDAHVLHVVRNPWSAYADTKKRPLPLPLAQYMLGWSLNQYFALLFRSRHPERVHIVRIEDVMAAPRETLGAICRELGLEESASLSTPTFNSEPLDEVYPWGTLRKVTPAANRATAGELSQHERALVREQAWQYLEVFDYKSFV